MEYQQQLQLREQATQTSRDYLLVLDALTKQRQLVEHLSQTLMNATQAFIITPTEVMRDIITELSCGYILAYQDLAKITAQHDQAHIMNLAAVDRYNTFLTEQLYDLSTAESR